MNIVGTNIMIDFTQEELRRVEEYNKRNGKHGFAWFKDLVMQELNKDELKYAHKNICPICSHEVFLVSPHVTNEHGEKIHLECWYRK